ncbi:zinc finger protein 708 [Biomphalaria pfeifferi]|uniref:Zinc finger protein 708 n=1 Tax=Biomphalaria pfeifferi TaxID=112525 RepID=A0AAD8CAM8_BIOPF|nr:zinc finger protein 708 [Biomphalaria pfeifferi]
MTDKDLTMNVDKVVAVENTSTLKIEGDNSENIEVKLIYNEESNSYELQISDLIGQMAPDTELIIISEVEDNQIDEHKGITYIDARDLSSLGNVVLNKNVKQTDGACNTTIVYTSENIKQEEIQAEDINQEILYQISESKQIPHSKNEEIDIKPNLSKIEPVLFIDNSDNSKSGQKPETIEVKVFVCEHCVETFTSSADLVNHKLSAHKSLIECEICNKQFLDSNVFKAHMLLHAMKKNFKCETCNKIFTQKGLFNKHQLLHSSKKPSVCETCGKTFSNHGYLIKHQQIHSAGEKQFQCEHCSKVFLHETYLKKHILVHTGDKPFECETCHATFAQKHLLEAHTLKHTGTKPFACDLCSKTFCQKRTLDKHLALHHEELKKIDCDTVPTPSNEVVNTADNPSNEIKTEETPSSESKTDETSGVEAIKFTIKKKDPDLTSENNYVCEICNKSFSYKGSWKTHKVIHLKEKPYSCDVCHKTFSFKGNLKTHKAIHLEDRPYKCGLCSKAFAQSGELKRHLLMHTGEKPYLCDICSKAFSHGSYLKKHKLVHRDEKPFKCECCTKVFSRQGYLKDHMLVHTGEKKFKCECGKAFSRSGYLKRHRVLHNGHIADDNDMIQEL